MEKELRISVSQSQQEEIPNGEGDTAQINGDSVFASQQQESHPHNQISNGEVDLVQITSSPVSQLPQQEENCQGEISITIPGQVDDSLTDGEVDSAQMKSSSVSPPQQEENCLGEIHITIQGQVDDSINYEKIELCKAVVEGDVEKAKRLMGNDQQRYRSMLCCSITERNQTAFHIATEARRTEFVEKMLEYVQPEDLELKDSNKNNAFCLAAIVGAKQIAEKMWGMNSNLLRIPGGRNMTPLYLAASFGQREMAMYLYKKYRESEVLVNIYDIFYASIRSNLYDLAVELLERGKELAVVNYEGHGTALHMLAKNPSVFTSKGKDVITHETNTSLKLLEHLWKSIEGLDGMDVAKYMDENKEIIFDAAKLGNSKFLKEFINIYPDLVRILDDNGLTIFQIALLYRHDAVFNLISMLGDFDKHFVAYLADVKGNNLLHLAGKYLDVFPRPLCKVPGAALQMQQELKNFKEVESFIMPSYREMRNSDGLTPREVFTKEHKDLKESGEKWMKKTAESSMLVATIIASVVFAAAFTVPGDYDEDGKPRFLKSTVFNSFTVADAITLSSASVSILLFLSILTSCYEEDDFLRSLPLKLMSGLLTLFVSIASMMLSFSLNFFLSYSEVKTSHLTILSLICVIGFGPVILFVCLQRRLLKDILQSSFCRKAYAN